MWPPMELNKPDREEIIRLYKDGFGINHIVYLLHNKYNIDQVNKTIRERLIELTAIAERTLGSDDGRDSNKTGDSTGS